MDFIDGCPICLEEYSYGKIPKILLCGHTICSQCLGKILTENNECPYCRTPFVPGEVFSNMSFIREIVENDVESLGQARAQFEAKLFQIVSLEVSKQQEVLNEVLQVQKSINQEVERIKEKIEKSIEEIGRQQALIMDEIETDMEFITVRVRKGKEFNALEDIENTIKKIRKKYINGDSKIELKTLETSELTQNLKIILTCLSGKSELQVVSYEVPMFQTESTLGNPLFRPRFNDRFSARNLFDPLPGGLTIYNIVEQSAQNIPHGFITQDSTCFQLHPNTICVINPSYLLYFDSDKEFVFTVKLKSLPSGYCLGRFEGDLMVIGGELENFQTDGKNVLLRRFRKNWETLPSLRVQRKFATAESIQNKVFVIGGNSDMTIEYFNGVDWNFLPVKLRVNWRNMLSCYSGNLIYLLGGDGAKNKDTSISVLNLETNQISEIDVMNEKAIKDFDSYCAYIDNQIYYNFGDKIFVYTLL